MNGLIQKSIITDNTLHYSKSSKSKLSEMGCFNTCREIGHVIIALHYRIPISRIQPQLELLEYRAEGADVAFAGIMIADMYIPASKLLPNIPQGIKQDLQEVYLILDFLKVPHNQRKQYINKMSVRVTHLLQHYSYLIEPLYNYLNSGNTLAQNISTIEELEQILSIKKSIL